jgi:hypothetical protein
MSNRLSICLVVLALVAAPRVVSAAFVSVQHVYDTVDLVELRSDKANCTACEPHTAIFVQGIRSGQPDPSSATYDFGGNADSATHCERLALMAMSKPGKYQFAIGSAGGSGSQGGQGTCRLVRVSP